MKEIWKAIKSNLTDSVTQLDKTVVRTNREMLYGAIACAAAGVVIGMLVSPKKHTSIANNNGSHNRTPNTQPEAGDGEKEIP